MYLVVSNWEVIPGHEKEFEEAGHKARAMLRDQPGVAMVEVFPSGGKHVVVHGYTDEAAYNAVVNTPGGGPFEKIVAETKIEEHARWLGSERGETVAHD